MKIARPMERAVYIVTDIECDGPRPGLHSMLSFASVAVTADGAEQGTFEAVLERLPEAAGDPDTLAWFQTQPEAWAAATRDPRSPERVMADFVGWVQGFEAGRVFTAFPLAFDGMWIDYYLKRFTPYAIVQGLYEDDRLFDSAGLCLKAYAAALTGREPWACTPQGLPAEWFGGHAHTHCAIDDARGYAHLLGVLMGLRTSQAP